MYFLARDPDRTGKRLAGLKAGAVFPWQDKRMIRGVGASFGVPDAVDRSWADLDYVATVNVYTEDQRRSIVERNLSLQAVRQMLDGTDAVATPKRGPGRPRRSAEAA